MQTVSEYDSDHSIKSHSLTPISSEDLDESSSKMAGGGMGSEVLLSINQNITEDLTFEN
jgi:hypothetical protein